MGDQNEVKSDGRRDFAYDDEGNLIEVREPAAGKVRQLTWDYRNGDSAAGAIGVLGTIAQDVVVAGGAFGLSLFNDVLEGTATAADLVGYGLRAAGFPDDRLFHRSFSQIGEALRHQSVTQLAYGAVRQVLSEEKKKSSSAKEAGLNPAVAGEWAYFAASFFLDPIDLAGQVINKAGAGLRKLGFHFQGAHGSDIGNAVSSVGHDVYTWSDFGIETQDFDLERLINSHFDSGRVGNGFEYAKAVDRVDRYFRLPETRAKLAGLGADQIRSAKEIAYTVELGKHVREVNTKHPYAKLGKTDEAMFAEIDNYLFHPDEGKVTAMRNLKDPAFLAETQATVQRVQALTKAAGSRLESSWETSPGNSNASWE